LIRPGKLWLTSAAIILVFAVVVFYWTHNHRPQTYLTGNVILLADQLRPEFIRESPLKDSFHRIDHEWLTNGWRCVSILSNGLTLWQTNTQYPIGTALEFSLQGRNLKFTSDIFDAEAKPDSWSWKDNQVFLVLKRGESAKDCAISYFPAPVLAENTEETSFAAMEGMELKTEDRKSVV